MADGQPLWGYPEVAAHLGISVQATRSRKSRGSLPALDDTTVPDRPRWKPVGRRFRTDLHGGPAHLLPSAPLDSEAS
ncbi:MarR family transcriptional regulator [Streptomyces sp. NPDC057271]|uniref:MarR family transcriptional regulator n=1 Tax=unclassified Streptomyces TaxID=2593676 RepID=UPI003636CB4C